MTEEGKISFILASASPRRKDLLTEAGYKFQVVCPNIDETAFYSKGMDSAEYTKALAIAKAKSVAKKFPDYFVVGADTVVDLKGKIIGKARNEVEAKSIVRRLFSQPHKVITGIAIVDSNWGIEMAESVTTVVYPKMMSDEEIAEHIKGGSWRDKAGAYGIQETGDKFVKRIKGSLTNVMGLPMERLQFMLKKFGITPEGQ